MTAFNIEYLISARDALTPVLRRAQAQFKSIEKTLKSLNSPVNLKIDTRDAMRQVELLKKKADSVVVRGSAGGVGAAKGVRVGGALVSGAAALGGGSLMTTGLGAAYEQSIALTSLTKATGGTALEMQNLSEVALELSSKTGMSKASIMEMMASSSKAGVATKNLRQDVEDLVKTSIAFDMEAGQTADVMSVLRNSYFTGQEYAAQQQGLMGMAEMMSYVADNGASSEAYLAEFMSRVSSVQQVLGVSTESLVAMGATFESLGIHGDKAATAMNSFQTNISKPSKEAVGAFSALGLSYSDLAKKINESGDLSGVIEQIVGATKGMTRTDAAAAMSTIFGQEFGDEAIRLGNGMAIYSKALADASDKSAQAAAFNKAYELQLGSFAKSVDRVREGFKNTLAVAFEPAMSLLADTMGDVMGWMAKHPMVAQLAGSIAMVGAGAGVLALALGAIAMVGAPVLAVVAAIGSLVWIVGQAWQRSSALQSAVSSLGDALAPIGAAFSSLGEAIFGTADGGEILNKVFVAIGAGLAVIVDTVATAIDGLMTLFNMARNVMDLNWSGVVDTAKGFITRTAERRENTFTNIRNDWNGTSPVQQAAAASDATKAQAGIATNPPMTQAANTQVQAANVAQAAATQTKDSATTGAASTVVNAQAALTQQQAAATQASVGNMFVVAAQQMMVAANQMMSAASRPLTVNVGGGSSSMGDQGR